MMDQPPIHEPGQPFGLFTLERPLGRGAAAEVWQAVETGDLGFTKRQALKLLRPPPGEMEAQKKALINEARICGRLKHPGVVDVYRVGEQDGELYIAMEYVDGPDLNTLLVALRRRGVEIPVRAALDAAIDLAEALDYAHNCRDDDGELLNVVHRDLKPSNVLVDRRGVLKISDWGLVKSTLNIESTTRGIVKGTPGYIAPEVWGGTRDFKPAADLFAVGAMLYEFIVGERLFQGRNLARIAEQVARRKPSEEAGKVAARCPELVPLMTRLLQRAPARRYATGADLAEELRPIQELYNDCSLRKFLREVRDIVDEIAPQSPTSRMSQARPVGSTGPGSTAALQRDPAPTDVSRTDSMSGMARDLAQPDAEETDRGRPPPTPLRPPAAAKAPQPRRTGASGPIPAPEPEPKTDPGLQAIPRVPEEEPPEEAADTVLPVVPGHVTDEGRIAGAEFADVPATRAMPVSKKVATLPDSGPHSRAARTTGGGSTRIGPDGKPRKRRRRKRPIAAPPPPPRKVPPPTVAVLVAVLGFLLLVMGIAAVALTMST